MSEPNVIYLVRHDGRYNYTRDIKPAAPKVFEPGQKSGVTGDWTMSQKMAAEMTGLVKAYGPWSTIELAHGHKVSGREVEIVAGPFPVREMSSDNPDHPLMTRSVITTPAGEIAWSNQFGTYLIPGGRMVSDLSLAMARTLGLVA